MAPLSGAPEAPVHVPDARRAAASQMAAFMAHCARDTGRSFPDWGSFSAWSSAEWLTFWRLFLEWSAPEVEGDPQPTCVGESVEAARFFPGLRLSFAANLLRARTPAEEDATALIARDETGRRLTLTRRALRARVETAAHGLRALGVGPGDRVVAIAKNDEQVVVACLAATGLDATWSSVGADQGAPSVLARFTQVRPRLLFAVGTQDYQGARRPLRERLEQVVAGLPTLEGLIALDGDRAALADLGLPVYDLTALEQAGAAAEPFAWPRLPFDHPLFVIFSSGTTGAPKCIVHGAGGTLLEHLKEQLLHSDFGPDDRLLFTTSPGWMMWNWQLSALAAGTTIVAYEGSPTHPAPDALWRVVAEEGVTVFGTSPAFLQYSRDVDLSPREGLDLTRLRAMQSTGAPLPERAYDWVARHVGDLPLQSISGGTDIIGCFVLGNPLLPVHRGQAQCVSLGMGMESLRPRGAAPDAVGELVCTTPFPSRPVCFLSDPEGARFHGAYFAQNEGLWTHGDFVQITAQGGVRVLGRSDGVMNIRGIRIGPAEIYAVLADFEEIRAAMAVEQRAPEDGGDSRVVLLLHLRPGASLDRPLTLRVKKEIATRTSRAHVPALIVAVDELPHTHNGKASEAAARDAVNGREVRNLAALRNPACLDALRAHSDLGGRFAGQRP